MSNVWYEKLAISATTSSGVTATSAGTFRGLLHAISYTPSTSVVPSTGGNMTITGERTGITLLNLDNLGSTAGATYYPRAGMVQLPLFDERITVTFSSGSTGGTKTGTVEFFIV